MYGEKVRDYKIVFATLPCVFPKTKLWCSRAHEKLLAQRWIYGAGESHMQTQRQLYPTKVNSVSDRYPIPVHILIPLLRTSMFNIHEQRKWKRTTKELAGFSLTWAVHLSYPFVANWRRKMKPESEYSSSFLAVVFGGSSLQGCQVAATLIGIHIPAIGSCRTVRSKDRNPNSISSSKNSHRTNKFSTLKNIHAS